MHNLRLKIFADGVNPDEVVSLGVDSIIQGFTTNPTLMRQAGITNYRQCIENLCTQVKGRPISFSVLSDSLDEMEYQAMEIAKLGSNVYVKIPIINTQGQSTKPVIERLARKGIKINATAVLTLEQVKDSCQALASATSGYISIFGGRIADTGRDPTIVIQSAVEMVASYPHLEIIWASPRELFNIIQANIVGCHIITLTLDILRKIPLIGKDLYSYSLETVALFHDAATSSGYTL